MWILRNNSLIQIDISEDNLYNNKITASCNGSKHHMYKEYTLSIELSSDRKRTAYIFRANDNSKYGASGEHDTIGEAINSMINYGFNINMYNPDSCVITKITKEQYIS